MKSSTMAVTVAGLFLATFAPAQADSLHGTWVGKGYVKPVDGERQTVKCRVNFTPQGSRVVALTATCSSTTTKIHQTGQLSMVRPDRYVGNFYNPEFDVSGRIRVSVSGSTMSVTFSGDRGHGGLSLSRH